jgi:RNA polymerase sigma-32 factor
MIRKKKEQSMDHYSDRRDLLQYYKEIKQHPLLTHEKEYELAKKYQGGDETAGHQIIQANLRFVVKVSRKYFYHGHNHLELIQEGNLGLIKALNKFDPERGIPFVYYAVWWIEAYIRTFLVKSGKVNTGTLSHAKNLFSLDESLINDGSNKSTWIDFLTETTDPERLYCGRDVSHKISSLLRHYFTYLSEREVSVLKQRYFFDPPVCLKDIGIQLGISKERVRQIQLKSMERLRNLITAHAGFSFQSSVSEAFPYRGSSQERLMRRGERRN